MNRLKLWVLLGLKRLRKLRTRIRLTFRGLELSDLLPRRLRRYDWRYRLPDEARRCPACGSGALALLDTLSLRGRDEGRRVGFATGCRSCGILFANPFPSDEELAEFYAPEGTWASTREDDREPGPDPGIAAGKLAVLFRGAVADFDVLDPPAGASVLDFGCGAGSFLNSLQDRGWETFGIEPALKTAFARHRELQTPPRDGRFDLVIVNHVLEHVGNPLEILDRLSRSLRPGGYLYVSLPNLETLPEHGDFKYCLKSKGHIIAYSRSCLTHLLRRAGLTVVDRLDEPDVDDLLTGGSRKRLRALAVKRGPRLRWPPLPLRGARRALRRYRAAHEADRGFWSRFVPVRARANLENLARRGQ